MGKNKNIIKKSYFLFSAAALLASVVFTYYYFLYTHEYPPGSSERIANFSADKVFQTRILITTIAKTLEPCLPLIKYVTQWAIPYPVDFQVLLQIINVLFIFSLVISTPFLLGEFNFHEKYFYSLLLFIPITWNYIFINGFIDGAGLYYSYDLPSLAFFSIGLTLFLKHKWLWFYPTFILACLNRESACFISLAGVIILINISTIHPQKFLKRNSELLKHCIAQSTIWLLSRLILSYLFINNPGAFFERPHSMLEFLKSIWTGEYHWAMRNPAWFLTIFAGTWIVPFFYLKHINEKGKRLLLVGLIYLLTLVFRSNMMEVRVYNELNIIIFVCSMLALKHKFTSNYATS